MCVRSSATPARDGTCRVVRTKQSNISAKIYFAAYSARHSHFRDILTRQIRRSSSIPANLNGLFSLPTGMAPLLSTAERSKSAHYAGYRPQQFACIDPCEIAKVCLVNLEWISACPKQPTTAENLLLLSEFAWWMHDSKLKHSAVRFD